MSKLAVSLVLLSTLFGCATPEVALEQANNGVSLAQSLQTELVRYKVNAKLSAERRLTTLQQQKAAELTSSRNDDLLAYLKAQSGAADPGSASRTLLRDASAKYTELIATQDAAQAELAERLAGLTKDLPSVAEKLAAVQKAMAALGTELSDKERLAIVATFLSDAKTIVAQNAAAAASAAAAAASSGGGS